MGKMYLLKEEELVVLLRYKRDCLIYEDAGADNLNYIDEAIADIPEELIYEWQDKYTLFQPKEENK
jgi:hypothetical protein